ncbi:MAG: hypothetical protein WD733_07845 [Bryobacterales bacterium]
MRFVRGLLRLLAIVFNLVVGFFLFGVGFIGSLTGEDLHFPLIPVGGDALTWTLMGLGLFALAATVLSLVRLSVVRFLMVLWNLLVVGLVGYAIVRSSYRFNGPEDFRNGMIFFAVSLLALWGAWAQMRAATSAPSE